MAELHPVGRLGSSEEVADAVLYLSAPGASFVTGHDLLVDGAFTAR
jgi:NAD(P)-dependent dehydrogenase (short-subunit alcohol dehydrogenase family)